MNATSLSRRTFLHANLIIIASQTAPRRTMVYYSLNRFHIIWPDSFCTILEFLDMVITHADQLALEEFSALRTRRLVQNIDIMATYKPVHLSENDKAAHAEDEVDDANELGKRAWEASMKWVTRPGHTSKLQNALRKYGPADGDKHPAAGRRDCSREEKRPTSRGRHANGRIRCCV